MSQSASFQVNDKIVNELFRDGIGIDITIKLNAERVYMPDKSIVNGGELYRLTPGFLFNNLPDKVCKGNTL